MAPLKNWDPVLGLPDTLEKLLKETEINNSFRESAVTDTLKDTMESSYAYLYRMQRDSVNYSRFHFQTREYLLNTTYNDIQKGLKENGDKLMELEKSENPDLDEIARLKRILAEYGEVRFGDIYLDEKRRVCINIDHDIIAPEVKEKFRTSSYYRSYTNLVTLTQNKSLFREIPVAIIDGEVRTDIMVYPLEQGTKIVFTHMTAKDVYNRQESQIFHDTCIMCIPNTVIHFVTSSKNDLLTGKISSTIKSDKYKTGMYFMSIMGSKKSTQLIPCEVSDMEITFVLDTKTKSLLESGDSEFTVSLIFFQDLHCYDFTMEADGTIPSKIKVYSSLEKYEEIPESKLFIPTIDGSVTPMPIPEENVLVFKSVYNGTMVDHYEPVYQCGVNLYYPNIYQIDDPNQKIVDRYRVYFFYKDLNDIKYTPLFDFYWKYLRSRFKDRYTMEEVLNKIYFREDGYLINELIDENEPNPDILNLRELSADALESFYSLFEKMLEYQDYKYKYSTPDFISEYQGDNIPLQYKIARMMEFIKADWKVLPEYVKKERHKETLFHFFTNTINLSGRFRRSTRLEDREGTKELFAISVKLTSETNENALLVVDKKNYDKENEIYIDDAKLGLSSVVVGDYVEATNLTNRYVFAFKNPGDDFLAMKIFIDGILCTDVVTVHSLGMDYLYLPVNMVNENSYIMMELEWTADDPQVETIEFPNNEVWQTIHLIEDYRVEYTMNDIVLKVNGITLDEDTYTVKLRRHEIDYSMEDERREIENKYGIVTDVSIQLTNVKETFPLMVDIIINKTSFVSSGVSVRNGYPRFNLSSLKLNPDRMYARMYFNGRITPLNTYRLIDSQGRSYVQSRIFFQKGDQFFFEFSPYAKEMICQMEEFDPNEILDLSNYIDKPLDPEYYEIYVNGRRLGLPNVFAFGPKNTVFRGVKSKYLLTIYEKERDFEYFGYSKIMKDGESFFYTVNDLTNEPFITVRDLDVIIDKYIEAVKHEDAIILPNDLTEEKITFTIENGLIEEMKIFFFEELLPLGLGDPDTVQFNKAYFSEVFPNFTKEFMIEGEDDDPDVIYLNPDITARIYNRETNEYEFIDTAEADDDKAYVMVTGESK